MPSTLQPPVARDAYAQAPAAGPLVQAARPGPMRPLERLTSWRTTVATDFGRQITPAPVRTSSAAQIVDTLEASAVSDLVDYVFSKRVLPMADVEEADESTTDSDGSDGASSDDGDWTDLKSGDKKCASLWTWHACGLPLSGFFLAFLNATVTGVSYGFFLGYMGLESNVMMSVTSLMQLPQVLLLPIGVMNDSIPIFGYNRKPYLLAAWMICGGALLTMSLTPLPAPYYCQHPDGSYDLLSAPCNPDIHAFKNWYVLPLLILVAGIQLGCVAGEGLLLEYSQGEPLECRGKMKAEFTMVTMAGSLTSAAVIGIFMNRKEYLGTFDWGLSFNDLMMVCFVIAGCMLLISVRCVHESRKVQRPSFSAHVESSWGLVKNKGLASVLLYAFITQFLSTITTTARPLVRSQWAKVKVLQAQLFQMGATFVMILATWIYKVYFLQSSWRKAIFLAIVTVTVIDAIPSFLTIFDVIRNQYFYLGDSIVSAVPTAALGLILNLMVIELAEPGQEGLCYGLVGTVMHSSQPVSIAVSNQISGLFTPSIANPKNYAADTFGFRETVAWSYVFMYAASFLGAFALPLIPRQKEDAQRRKLEWSSSPLMTMLVLGVPALCLPYGVTVLILTSQPETACLRWVGGPGC